MEARVAALEAHMVNVRDDISQLKADVGASTFDIGAIKTDVALIQRDIVHLPTKTWGVKAAISFGAVVAVLVGTSTLVNILMTPRAPERPPGLIFPK